jgi:hypothetical protein
MVYRLVGDKVIKLLGGWYIGLLVVGKLLLIRKQLHSQEDITKQGL